MKNKPFLIAGPWVGEFGWEVAKWVPHVRNMAKWFSKTIIICQESSKFLYEDFECEFFFPDIYGSSYSRNAWNACPFSEEDASGVFNEALKRFNIPQSSAYHLLPSEKNMNKDAPVKYYKYPDGKHPTKILFHFRKSNQCCFKNWSEDKWKNLTDQVIAKGANVGFIGTVNDGIAGKGATDYRGIGLRELSLLIRNSDVVVGASSGVMHFAAFCGANLVVWGDSKQWGNGVNRGTLKERYLSLWNPFKSKVHYVDNCQPWEPTVDEVFCAMKGWEHGF